MAFNAEVHDVISANGAVVNDDVPSPKRYGVPFLNLESFLFSFAGAGGHLNVKIDLGHDIFRMMSHG